MKLPLLNARCFLALCLFAFSSGPLFAQTPPNVPELERLETAHAREVGEKLDAPLLAGLQRLNDSYRITLDAAIRKAIAAGNLDETLAYQNESKRFGAASNMPDQDEPGLNPNVAKLRAFWRTEAERLTKIRATALPPLDAAYLGSLRSLEKELTRAVKIDEAQAVRNRINALAAAAPQEPAAPIAPPSAPVAAKPGIAVMPSARPADKADLYASCNNGGNLYLNGKEIVPRMNRDAAGKVRIALKEGDVLAARSTERFEVNSFWISCLAPTGEFLFDTSMGWKSYLPVVTEKWWETKKPREQQAVEEAPDTQPGVDVVKKAALLTPAYHGGQPIRSTLKDDGGRGNYVMYTVTKADLLPKKVDPALVFDFQALSAPFIGKVIRIATARSGPDCIVLGETDPAIAKYEPAKGQFKASRGTLPGTLVFESLARPGFYLRHEGYKLHTLKGINGDCLFFVNQPLAGTQGNSLSAENHYRSFLIVNDRNGLDLVIPGKMRDLQKAVFFLEPAPVK